MKERKMKNNAVTFDLYSREILSEQKDEFK
jgi:hypothetical protein